jgi:hypothetical protein
VAGCFENSIVPSSCRKDESICWSPKRQLLWKESAPFTYGHPPLELRTTRRRDRAATSPAP